MFYNILITIKYYTSTIDTIKYYSINGTVVNQQRYFLK